jgi:hypothetical protein
MDRLQLQLLLESVIGTGKKVYFQPPPSKEMVYPCIVYARDQRQTEFADNAPYRTTRRYQVTLISRDPDDPTVEKLAMLPMCVQATTFVRQNLNHDVFELYF